MRKQSSPLSIMVFLVVAAAVVYYRQHTAGPHNTLWILIAVVVVVGGIVRIIIRKRRNVRIAGITSTGSVMPSIGSMINDVTTQFMSMGQPMTIPGLPAGTIAVHLPALDSEAPQYFVMWKLAGSIGGHLILQRQGQKPLWGNDRQLESIEFNKETQVYASSADLPYKLLAPDFMDWYLRVPTPPAIVIRDAEIWLYFISPYIPSEENIPGIVQTVAQAIEKSGAINSVKS